MYAVRARTRSTADKLHMGFWCLLNTIIISVSVRIQNNTVWIFRFDLQLIKCVVHGQVELGYHKLFVITNTHVQITYREHEPIVSTRVVDREREISHIQIDIARCSILRLFTSARFGTSAIEKSGHAFA